MKFIRFTLYVVILLVGCKATNLPVSNSVLYRKAVEDAMYVEEREIDSNLVDVTWNNHSLIRNPKDSQYILMVSWIPQKFSYPDSGIYKTGDREMWATVAPELATTMWKEKANDINLRLQQLLGLPPNDRPNQLFLEFWVKPGDLFRPCPDKEITDKRCNLCFTKEDSLDQNHIQWITNKRLSNYNCDGLYKHYPWTALGYTYDWSPSNSSHRGVSEFVVKKNTTIIVKRMVKTAEYVKGTTD